MSTVTTPLPNRFRHELLAGKRLIGCWSSLGSPITAEILGLADFDWLLLDAEHAPNDVLSLIPQLMALKDSTSAPVVRPPWNDMVTIKRLIDIGFFNFLIPFVRSVEEAKAAVAATRYPPEGVRGVSMAQRSNRYGTIEGYQRTVNDNIAVIVQIETPAAAAIAGDIAAVAGVDGLFVGPSDLAAFCGHLGNPGHREVQALIGQIFDAAKAAGKPSGILAPVEADARRYMDMGATLVAVGSDLGVFRNATRNLRDTYLRHTAEWGSK